jgi:hypothetical protein
MITHPGSRLRGVAALILLAGGSAACADASPPTGLGSKRVAVSSDTVNGTGSLSELQQRRAAWIARGIVDYRVQLAISCFCATDFTRPVLIEVRRGVVTTVWDLETAKRLTTLSSYPTVTGLFDAAIAERSRGGNVSVTYDVVSGLPVRIEVGTVANDAGAMYWLGGLTPL